MTAPFTRLYRRRAVLHLAVVGATGAILAACGDEAAAPTATTAPVSPTVAARPTLGATLVPPAATVAPTAAATAPGAMAAVAPTAAIAPAVTPTQAATATSVPVVAARPTIDGLEKSTVPGVPDLYTKSPAPFKSVAMLPGRASKVTSFHISYGNPPLPPRNENVYLQDLDKRLGVTLEPNVAPVGSYREKLSALVAGGDIPDLTLLVLASAPDQSRVIQQGGYTDLTPYLTGAGLQEFPNLAALPDYLWKNLTIRGKIYGVPRPTTLVGNTLVFRQDWADKLGMGQPKNAEEFFQLAVAMTKGDPDGNGQADTYAFGSGGNGTLNFEIFRNFFRVPNRWRLNPDGSLTAAQETDEYRQTVAYMRRLYEAGTFHPDSPTMNTTQAKQLFGAGKFGAYQDGTGGVSDFRPRGRFALPAGSNANGFVPFGYDGGKATTYRGNGLIGFTAIPAKVGRDRERTRELLRICDYFCAPYGSEEKMFLDFGLEGVHHTVRPDGTRERTMRGSLERGDLANLCKSVDALTAIGETADEGRRQQKLLEGLTALAIDDPAQNAYSPAFAARAGELERLETDRLIAVVTGREPLASLDGFVRDWRSRGGDMIRKELEADLKA